MPKNNLRTRNYASIFYPDSAPADWLEILSDLHISCFVSPLHDSDVTVDGELKKPHYHVMIMFENVKSEAQARELFDQIGGVGCEIVNTIRGYARYLCHLDNPEKARYDMGFVRELCGADYHSIISLASDKYAAIAEMITYCKENNVLSYAELFEYSMLNRYDWYRTLCDNGTVVVKEYLKSKSWYIAYCYERSKNENH